MRLLVAVLSLALAGCAQVNRFRTDISAPVPGVGQEEIALRNDLAIAFEEKTKDTAGAYGCIETSVRSGRCLTFRQMPGDGEVARYLDSAFSLTDSLCDTFFRATNAAALRRQNARANVNDVGTLLTAILGFAKAGSISTSIVASTTGFSDSMIRNYDTSFLVTPDLATLQPLVRAEQADIRKSILGAPPTTFQAARSAALLYAEPCTYLGMKRLLTKAAQLQTSVTTAVTKAAQSSQADTDVSIRVQGRPSPAETGGRADTGRDTAVTTGQATASTSGAAASPVASAPAASSSLSAVVISTSLAANLQGAVAQSGRFPATQWGNGGGRTAWTSAVLAEVRGGGAGLWSAGFLPKDIAAFCPDYADRGVADRQAFWTGLVSAIAGFETSGFRPDEVYRERDGTFSVGLLQLSVSDAAIGHYNCGFIDDVTIRDPLANLRCGVRILTWHVTRDGVIAQGKDHRTARGAARYWGPMRTSKRSEAAAWTARQEYCRVS